MSRDLETVLREALRDSAPRRVPPGSWPQLRRAADRRRLRSRAGVAVAAAAAVATPVGGYAVLTGPAAPRDGGTMAALEPRSGRLVPGAALDEAMAADRSPSSAPRAVVAAAFDALLHETGVAAGDVTAWRVLWSVPTEASMPNVSQGPVALVAARTGEEWVVGFWDERRPSGTWVRTISGIHRLPADTEPDAQLIAVQIDPSAFPNTTGRHVVALGPVGAARTELLVGDQVPIALPQDPFGDVLLDPNLPLTVRAVDASGGVIAEKRFS